jgi:hypothetical protein
MSLMMMMMIIIIIIIIIITAPRLLKFGIIETRSFLRSRGRRAHWIRGWVGKSPGLGGVEK